MEKLDQRSYEDNVICLHKSTYKKRVTRSEFDTTITAKITFCKRCGKGIRVVIEKIETLPVAVQ